LFVNARGLISKIDILKAYVKEMGLDIIGVAETFLSDDVMQAEISIEGYTMYRKDRCNFKEGKAGGVVLCIRHEIVSYEFHDLNKSQSESVWCNIKVNRNDSITIGVCYKSQAASDEELNELYKVIKSASQANVLMMGDFNYPKINWDTLDCDSSSMTYRDLILDNYLYQHVRQPTRENNILDLVISSNVNMVNDVQVLEHLGNSDHNILVWNLICDVGMIKNKKPIRKYHKADYESMRKWFMNIDWNKECGELSVS
jgi:endonuclease/exonuclease/phosphatase family metal-dependent hydrolase